MALPHHKRWKYRNFIILLISVVLAAFLVKQEFLRSFLLGLGGLGYLGAFIAGILFVSTFTVSIGAIIFSILSQSLSPIEIGIIGGLGAVTGDFVIFRFVKDSLIEEIEPLYEHFGGNHLNHILHTRYFSWLLPLIGTILIATPLPDEVGVSLLGLSKMKTYQFILISLPLHIVGIYLVMLATAAFY